MAITKSAFSDPYMCRGCERLMDGSDFSRYAFLDRANQY
jgi:hypothetical protein